MSKLIGGVFVLIAAAGIGNEQARQVRRRLDALYQCKMLVTFLQSQIRYAGADLEEMLRDTAGRLYGPFREFCLVLAETLQSLPGREFPEIWQAGITACLATSGLTEADLALLGTAGAALGYLDGESQCRHLQNYLERLAPEIARAEVETGPQSRLYRSLGICAGLFLTLLLI